MAVQMAFHKHTSPDADHTRFAELHGDYEYASSRFLMAMFGYISRMVLGVLGIGFAAGLVTGLLFGWLL
jgi:hypothetical protein